MTSHRTLLQHVRAEELFRCSQTEEHSINIRSKKKRLTVFIQEELIKAQTTGLLPNETVHILCAVVVNSDGVLQRLDAGLQTEGNLGISNCVSAKDTR